MDTQNFENKLTQLLRYDPLNIRKRQLFALSNALGAAAIIVSYPFIIALILFGNGNGLTDYQSMICVLAAVASLPLWLAAGIKQQEWKIL